MIKRISLFVLTLLLPALSPAKNITLVVDDVPVVQLLQSLADLEQKNMVISPDVQGTLSLQLRNLPWQQALQTVINSMELVLRQENGVYYVHTQRWREEKQALMRQENEKRQLALPLMNRSLVLPVS